MSTNFNGVTFAKQKVTPSDDAIIRRAILPDGILYGCELSYSGSTLTMAAGQLMICGRQIRHPASQNWAVIDATSGFARLLLTIDLTKTATKESFEQVVDSIEYASAEDGFLDLEQTDINVSGSRYQVVACVVSLGAGGITSIVSQLGKSVVEGSGGLNFNVVGGLTQPADPSKNTIWVPTDVDITGWYFYSQQPEDMKQGEVWFLTGTSSPVAFNALKKNDIEVYPLSAKQYVDGELVGVEAKIYQNGEWCEWLTYLYNTGTDIASLTGGWTSTALVCLTDQYGSYGGGAAPQLTMESSSMIVSTPTGSGLVHTNNKIDLTEYRTLKMLGSMISDNYPELTGLAVCGELKAPYSKNYVAVKYPEQANVEETGLFSVDISTLSGEYYICLACGKIAGASTPTIVARSIWLE